MVADNSSIGHTMGMDEKKAEMLEAYIKNQYVRTIVKVIKFKILYKNGEINCLHYIFLTIYACLILQISNDKANCGIYSILAQIQGVPEDYSAKHFRRWMVVHLLQQPEKYFVSTLINFKNLTFIDKLNSILSNNV